MAGFSFEEILIVAISAFAASALALLLAWFGRTQTNPAKALIQGMGDRPVFLFEDETLIDMTEPAREYFKHLPKKASDWFTFSSSMADRFPELAEGMASIARDGEAKFNAASPNDTAEIHAEWWDGTVRLEILENNPDMPQHTMSRECHDAMERELHLLRHAIENAPIAIWQSQDERGITWANRNYLDLVESKEAWPPAIAFPNQNETTGKTERLRCRTNGSWYDVETSVYGDTLLGFASAAGAEVEAEEARREFIQTLSKTFAHLSVGLAIFDNKRRLVLFNPALTDLLTLPADFLISHPSLFSFLDRLRDRRMMPEPKNYKSWREQMMALESAAEDGKYQETWSLPGGQTYRVIGRPYPDGAIAFQFEDITPEVALTRNFRSELELSQSVLDTLPNAIAVFSAGGVLTLSNRAYASVWGIDPSTTFGEITISESLTLWRSKCSDSASLQEIENALFKISDEKNLSKKITLDSGQSFQVNLTVMQGGAVTVTFARIETEPPKRLLLKEPIFQSSR